MFLCTIHLICPRVPWYLFAYMALSEGELWRGSSCHLVHKLATALFWIWLRWWKTHTSATTHFSTATDEPFFTSRLFEVYKFEVSPALSAYEIHLNHYFAVFPLHFHSCIHHTLWFYCTILEDWGIARRAAGSIQFVSFSLRIFYPDWLLLWTVPSQLNEASNGVVWLEWLLDWWLQIGDCFVMSCPWHPN